MQRLARLGLALLPSAESTKVGYPNNQQIDSSIRSEARYLRFWGRRHRII
jgi:hypothetical protein